MGIKKQSLKIKRNLLVGLSTVAMLAGVGKPAVAQAQGIDVDAEASITVDYETEQILQGQAIDEPLGIASISKMLAEYIVFEEVEAGDIDWDTEIEISDYAYTISQNYGLSNVPLKKDELYTLEELYHSMAIYSANGATIAIAEAISGSEEEFVNRMRETVESFGIEDASLFNATGLNNNDLEGNIYPESATDDENTMSARSVATITNQILMDYPEILETASIPKMTFREGSPDAIEMTNWNMMLDGLMMERAGVDGLKTGTTNYAGPTFTGTAKEGERRLITVVLDSGEDMTTRFRETDKLMDYGFDQFSPVDALADWEDNLEYDALVVTNGKEDYLDYEPSEELEILMQSDNTIEEDLTFSIEWDANVVSKEESIEAPITKGMELGRLTVNYEDNELGYLSGEQEASVPIIAKNDVEKAGVFKQLWNGTKNIFQGLMDRFN